MENHENLIGKILGGRYKIEDIVGEGGMSVVMKAYDALKMREVTIKLLSVKNTADQNAVERFTNEAKAVALLSHPNIVSVYDVSLEGASKYIVMEYISGITLKEYLDRKGRLSWPEAVHYTNQVLAALSHAHEKGVIHRDIKPENVMLMRNGSIKVIDFGIAKLPDSKSLTVIDKAIGTVNYISPEQASGHGSTEKSDIYSTGIMLYELVTGQLPFVSASSVSVAMMHVSSEPAMPSSICDSIPTGLEQIIIKAMMKDPERRFGSAIAMKKALEYLTAYPATIFKEKNATGPDGKPILSTGAPTNNGNNTVITSEISPLDEDEEEQENNNADTNGDYDNADDINEEDDEYGYSKPRGSSMLPIVLGVTLAFFTVVAVFFMLLYNKAKDADSDSGLGAALSLFNTKDHRDANDALVVPDLLGKEYTNELRDELQKEGFRLDVKEVFNEKVQAGHIVSQTPLGGSTKKKNADGVLISLEVSQGISEIVLDNYDHCNAASIKLDLEDLGLRVKIEKEFHESVIKGHIIRTEPGAKSILFEGDTVTLFVSTGPEDLLVEIPETVLGLTYDKAEYLLQDMGLNVDSERGYAYSDEYPADTIMGTEPAIGTEVSVNTDKVKLIISKGNNPMTGAIETGTYIPGGIYIEEIPYQPDIPTENLPLTGSTSTEETVGDSVSEPTTETAPENTPTEENAGEMLSPYMPAAPSGDIPYIDSEDTTDVAGSLPLGA